MIAEKIVLNEERNVTLTAYLQEVGGEFGNIPKRPAVLVIPGGGYSMCSDREADPAALAFMQAGYQAFVLRYSVMKHAQWPNPLNDYEQAMKLICSRAEEWNLYSDKVAVIGFSAGGHLAAAAATIAENKPAAAILGYALTEGKSVQEWLPSAPDLVSRVDKRTCPCFVFATRNDAAVPVRNSLNFVKALEENGVMFESHIYAYGAHGFSVANSSVMAPGAAPMCSRTSHWVADSIEWLKDVLGDFSDGKLDVPTYGTRVNGNEDECLSIDCTLGYLMENEQARAILTPMLEAAKEKGGEEKGGQTGPFEEGAAANMANRLTLRSILGYGNVPEEMVERLNEELKGIPNAK